MKSQARLLGLAAATWLVVGAMPAQALNSVSILWRGFGSTVGSPTDVAASSTLTADIVLTADSLGVMGIAISIAFDAGELQYISGQEFTSVDLPGMGNVFHPLVLGVTVDNTNGVITGFEQAGLSAEGQISGTRTLGSFMFHVGSPANGPFDIDIIANMDGESDFIFDQFGQPLPNPEFNGASVTPEPTTALLLMAGLATLLWSQRARQD